MNMSVVQMPQYKCHKTVRAMKIKAILNSPPDVVVDGGSWDLEMVDGTFHRVSHAWVVKHNPEAGGYYVAYEDGYKSYSPSKTFEAGYICISNESSASIERDIQAAGKTAPRVRLQDIEANIDSEHYFTAHQGDSKAIEDEAFARGNGSLNLAGARSTPDHLRLLTFCVLVLRNGFTVTGESACASPENFDAEIGRRIARDNAIQKVWPLLGFLLREQLAAAQ